VARVLRGAPRDKRHQERAALVARADQPHVELPGCPWLDERSAAQPFPGRNVAVRAPQSQ